MSSDQIPGVPEGWELVHANRAVKPEEYFIDRAGNVVYWNAEEESAAVFPIVRKIEKPARYRPFANAEEFKPHRDRWWYRNDQDGRRRHFPPASYSDKTHNGAAWQHRFETCFFDDGTPFGVKIDE
jgi:hypothetical protein